MITIHQRHRQTDRQTDRQTTCDRNTALCTKVHRAVKIVATGCQILRLKRTKFNFGRGSAPDPAPQTPWLDLGPTSKGREGKYAPFKFLNTPLVAITRIRIHVIAKPYVYFLLYDIVCIVQLIAL